MVGNDSTFYRPETANQLRHYFNSIPEDFEMCFKVWEELAIPTYAKQTRYGPKAGQPNPRFLLNVESTPTTSKRKSTISNGRVRPQTLLRWSHQAPRREHRSALPSQRKKAARE
jgi:hypothetical protein